MAEAALMPGWPGRGWEPDAGLTDLQWYMYHQANVVYFAAFSAEDLDSAGVLALARDLIAAAPQFARYYRGAGGPPSDAVLARLATIETVADFAGLPERWLDDGSAVFGDADLPFFRIRVARLAGPDGTGRRSFLLVQLSHILAEGTDSAQLSRSRSAEHGPVRAASRSPFWIVAAARAFAALAIPGHLVASRLVTPHPGTIRVATRVLPRKTIALAARTLGVRQRALLFALAAHVIAGGGTPRGKRTISSTYSTLDHGGGASRDSFLRMRMLFAAFRNRPDFPAFVRALDARLTAAEASETGFNAEMNAAAVGFHRRLSRLLPRLYSPRTFAFMPYDLVFALIPPHRLGGALSQGLLEPVWCGATMPGINGCVAVPGREFVTLNFYIEEDLVPRLDALDRLIAHLAVTSRSASPGDKIPAALTPVG